MTPEALRSAGASHPLRVEILRALAQRPMSPVMFHREHAEDWTLPLVSYHFRVLRDRGALVEHDTIPRRGAIEHVYRVSERPAGPEAVAALALEAAAMLSAQPVLQWDAAQDLAARIRAAVPHA